MTQDSNSKNLQDDAQQNQANQDQAAVSNIDTTANDTIDTSSVTENDDENSTKNDAENVTKSTNECIAADNGVELANCLAPYFRPDEQTIVCGALNQDRVLALAKAGVELVINLQPDAELNFDEATAVQQAGMVYEHLPISGTSDLKQLNILTFDNLLRQYHGKKIAMHCKSGSRVGAAIALRAGWLRGRKMETAMARGYSHGLTEMFEQETRNRLLVPR